MDLEEIVHRTDSRKDTRLAEILNHDTKTIIEEIVLDQISRNQISAL